MKVKITKPCVIEVLPGSVVEISDRQFKFLHNYCELIEEKETATPQKQTRKAKK